MTRFEHLLSFLFGEPDDLSRGADCPPYMKRWRIIASDEEGVDPFRVYLHKFEGHDWTEDMHDHPKRFISIGLKGWYIEQTPGPESLVDDADKLERAPLWPSWGVPNERVYRAPWIRSFPAYYIHRILTPKPPCWTLCITGKYTQKWGFFTRSGWISSAEYFKDELRNCKDGEAYHAD
jgi:hypothetical protein